MIDIIIPCYNSHNTLDITLQSIAIQSIKDKIKVLLVDDYSKKGYEKFVTLYSKYFDISILRLNENKGPGVAREQGILNTNNEYIIFIDSDDTLYDSDSIETLFNKIEEGFDLVNSLEYDQKHDTYRLINGNIHGKIYRRKYINEHNIHFNNYRFHEDNYFNNHVLLSGAKYGNLDKCTYFYTYNHKSITNED